MADIITGRAPPSPMLRICGVRQDSRILGLWSISFYFCLPLRPTQRRPSPPTRSPSHGCRQGRRRSEWTSGHARSSSPRRSSSSRFGTRPARSGSSPSAGATTAQLTALSSLTTPPAGSVPTLAIAHHCRRPQFAVHTKHCFRVPCNSPAGPPYPAVVFGPHRSPCANP